MANLKASKIDVDRNPAVTGLRIYEGLVQEVLSQSIPELRAGTWRLISFQVTAVWEEWPNRIVFLLVTYEDQTSKSTKSTEMVAKIYRRNEGGAHALGALHELWRAGFRSPARYRVTRPYGYAPASGVLFQARAPGVLWADLLGGDKTWLLAASARAASWLVRLQNTALADRANSGHDGDAALVQHATRELVSTFPDHVSRFQPVANRLIELLPSEGIARVPSHGGFHPGNVLLTPGVTTVIDFDKFGWREPAFDVGYCIGRLLIMSYFGRGEFIPGACAALSFWRRYKQEGRAPWSRVSVQVSRFLLQCLHYELCVLRKNREDLLDWWPDLIEEWLCSHGPATLGALTNHR